MVEKASVVWVIVDTYFAPNKTAPEVRKLMNSDAVDPLRAFSEECREELSKPLSPLAQLNEVSNGSPYEPNGSPSEPHPEQAAPEPLAY